MASDQLVAVLQPIRFQFVESLLFNMNFNMGIA